VDDNGQLRDPIAAGLIRTYEGRAIAKKWKFGDQAPAETAWRRSSGYAYSIIKLLALTRPAKFFGVFLDNSRLTTNTAGNVIDSDTGVRQRLSTARYHLETVTNTETGVITDISDSGLSTPCGELSDQEQSGSSGVLLRQAEKFIGAVGLQVGRIHGQGQSQDTDRFCVSGIHIRLTVHTR
jgi:hypothetical protein